MDTKRYELNKQLAQMLKGGVIMDVTTPEQARIAEEAGACAVMALERIPADIRAVGGVATPADAALMMQLGAEGVFVGSGIFKSGDPKKRAAAIVKAVTNYQDSKMLAELSEDLGEAMVDINEQGIQLLMAERGKQSRMKIGILAVQGKLLRELDMFDTLKMQIEQGKPVLATCAGLILLAKEISNDEHVYFGTLPVTVKRNAYGRQLGSFFTIQEMKGIGKVPMTFIRAPYIEKADDGTEILAEVDGNIVAVKSGKQYGLSFHPELDEDDRIHEMFLKECENQ